MRYIKFCVTMPMNEKKIPFSHINTMIDIIPAEIRHTFDRNNTKILDEMSIHLGRSQALLLCLCNNLLYTYLNRYIFRYVCPSLMIACVRAALCLHNNQHRDKS